MNKFYRHKEFFNPDENADWLILIWWDSDEPYCYNKTINTAISLLTEKDQAIYQEFKNSPVFFDPTIDRGNDVRNQILSGLIEGDL